MNKNKAAKNKVGNEAKKTKKAKATAAAKNIQLDCLSVRNWDVVGISS